MSFLKSSLFGIFAASLVFFPALSRGFTPLAFSTSTSTFGNVGRRRQGSVSLQMSDIEHLSDLRVMVNGMPGPMATAAAQSCLRKGLELAPCAMTGPGMPTSIIVTDDVTGRSANVKLIPSSQMEEVGLMVEGLKEAHGNFNLIAVDYTHPSAVNANGDFYAKNAIPFVMGTTGGDREKLIETVTDAGVFAVIAPNMGKQIVAMQAALEDLASKYPLAFSGYSLQVKESHQKTKADTSGTAKAVVESLKKLSGDDGFAEEDIEMLRNDEDSLAFGVKEEALNGHAFHTYTLTSPDKSVEFVLKHNVSGRTLYADGTADAVIFLANKMRKESSGKVYNMINVLEDGAL
mmetsp:Transcript_49135/g.73011  ORF Transcript_49135/g.73011 Transcript_49135/m.73011 type:complete len:347 (+) Transcript_49135:131-1171(+)|eukprot:CAMPEP_0195509784 /NCGR_PEP_ID=MMETSP0794_2-20130614/2626_1 /TAXON_ID=515487 /ORGANISM="Stephanopyxis turris, Strain CCMP 815" /LENGTH=346 /DNA_ID=CAMNT_0040637087 /DNA_START=124 /DNA_END=1164 /DNA_ORIENTATION=-